MAALWRWVLDNKDAVTILLTFTGVLIAAIYALLTRNLARTTQRMYEASYRPYLQIIPDPRVFRRHDEYAFHFGLRAYGAVPAIVTEVHLRISGEGLPRPVHLAHYGGPCVYPGQEKATVITFEDHHAPPLAPDEQLPNVAVECLVSYKGPQRRPYTTQTFILGNLGTWKNGAYYVT